MRIFPSSMIWRIWRSIGGAGLGFQRESVLLVTLDPAGSGYQNVQALLSLGSGGIWGKGLGQGTQKIFYLHVPLAIVRPFNVYGPPGSATRFARASASCANARSQSASHQVIHRSIAAVFPVVTVTTRGVGAGACCTTVFGGAVWPGWSWT